MSSKVAAVATVSDDGGVVLLIDCGTRRLSISTSGVPHDENVAPVLVRVMRVAPGLQRESRRVECPDLTDDLAWLFEER